jgi:hypothetical protein
MSHQTQISDGKSSKDIMIQNPQDIQDNGEHKTLSQENTGGQEWEYSSNDTLTDAPHANK